MKTDHILPFLIENHPIKGSVVLLKKSWQRVLLNSNYPEVINKLLGELVLCSVLFTRALKFDGSFSIQIQGSGPIQILIAECNSKLQIRATATLDPDFNFDKPDESLLTLVDKGHLAISLNPKSGNAYQSIVPLVSNNVAEVFESYLIQSEQISSKLKLCSENDTIAGILIQKLPEDENSVASNLLWEHLSLVLENCLFRDLCDSETFLSSLAQDEDIRVFDQKEVSFSCNCTRDKISEVLLTLGEVDAKEIIANEGSIKVTCEFCRSIQEFDSIDIVTLFSSSKGTTSIH